jgi:hypothetical protein
MRPHGYRIRRFQHAVHQGTGAVRHVHHDAQAAAFGHHLGAQWRQPATDRFGGLAIAQRALDKVDQLQVAHTPGMSLGDTLGLTFQEIGALRGQQHAR